MKKIGVFVLLLIISCVIAAIYGVLHDQITYSISDEYYTKFKFIQFGLIENNSEFIINNPRLLVSIVGIMATWWVGLIAGMVLGILGFCYKESYKMFYNVFKAFLFVISIAVIFGFIGFIYGNYFMDSTKINWNFPENLIQKKDFITVGSIHNFSYLGGLIGIFVGIINLVKNLLRNKV